MSRTSNIFASVVPTHYGIRANPYFASSTCLSCPPCLPSNNTVAPITPVLATRSVANMQSFRRPLKILPYQTAKKNDQKKIIDLTYSYVPVLDSSLTRYPERRLAMNRFYAILSPLSATYMRPQYSAQNLLGRSTSQTSCLRPGSDRRSPGRKLVTCSENHYVRRPSQVRNSPF